MMRGGNLLALQKLGGWRSLKMVERYAHLAPDYLRSEIMRTERPAKEASGSKTVAATAASDGDDLQMADISDAAGAGGGSRTRDLLITNQLLCL
jgi:hypothetical protein